MLAPLFALWLAGAPAAAEEPLTAVEVLQAVDARIPKLAAVRAALAEKEAKVLSSRASFEPTYQAKAKWKDQDPYEWTVTDQALSLALPQGPSVGLGYRTGLGKLPVYEGKDKTDDFGELRIEATIPLLRDLGLPPERAALLVAEAERDAAVAKITQAEVETVGKAALSWAKWVATGEKVTLAQAQVELAERRQSGLQREVEEGATARIYLIDNERALVERRAALVAAQRDLEVAALALSLWYRDSAFNPVVATPDRLPPPAMAPPPPLGDAEATVERARSSHPVLGMLNAMLSAANTELRRARRVRLPDLAINGAVAQDQGPGGPGSVETLAGASLKVPLLNRKGRGSVGAAEAVLTRIEADRRGAIDQVTVDVRQAWAAADAAHQRWTQAAEAAAAAQEVAQLERRARELGASDLFRVLKREETAAKAEKDLIEARLEWRAAVVAAAVASGQRVTPERL